MSYSLWPYWLQHSRLPCPSLPSTVCSNSRIPESSADQHQSFNLLPFQRGLVHPSLGIRPSLGNLVVLHSQEVTILRPNFLRHPVDIVHCSPQLLGSRDLAASASWVAGITGMRFYTTKETISKAKGKPSEWGKMISNETTDK